MSSRWYRNRFVWVAVILAMTVGAVALVKSVGQPETEPADLQTQIMSRMRTTLERTDPGQHNHGNHTGQQVANAGKDEKPPVVCGVRVYGFEPSSAATLAEVTTVYGFHMCGVAEAGMPWDVAVKLAGPVILDMSAEPVGIQVVEATAEIRYVDRLKQMFPAKYADVAQREALSEKEMADLRRRYDAAAKA